LPLLLTKALNALKHTRDEMHQDGSMGFLLLTLCSKGGRYTATVFLKAFIQPH